jgi:hypothetical protein
MDAMPDPPFGGRCLCGAIRYACDARPLWQRVWAVEGGNLATTAVLAMADGHWVWSWREPTRFILVSGERRFFCPTCGTQLAFRSPGLGEVMLFHAATLTDPAEEVPDPSLPAAELQPWVPPDDGLLLP